MDTYIKLTMSIIKELSILGLLCCAMNVNAQQIKHSDSENKKDNSLIASRLPSTFKDSTYHINTICQSFYSQHLGFFCKEEIYIEQALHTPIKIRLGSINYCNWMEQKPGYEYYQWTR